ncbi:LysR family transcriptional regulator [Actinoallomurus iriomotensis]|uniref:LysR family transcriptional regulator n=1 Tax=Actinoallomurus iriomotensis TaxID=478107 RepID=A0A9W6S793_9ACTN|nr:LysR family transcriptional regulator [Actinoallomurus iriomotensis]GLY88684.1 LysR family transcriptional regulator [Actinoallomurus iriomotensis]
MTLRQFEYLIAVAEEHSFTRAAERLLVSQPALSHQIKVLEDQIGGPLLDRLARTVEVTELGDAFLPHAVAAVRSTDEATCAARAVGRLSGGELRVATLRSIALGIIPQAIRVWRHEHPRVRVRIREFGHIDLLAAEMLHGGADVGIGPAPAGWTGRCRILGLEEFFVILPYDDPELWNCGGSIDLRRLADRPWVLYAPEFGLASFAGAAFARAGFTPRASVRTHHTATAVELAAAGLGPALVPGNVIGPDFERCTIRPEPPIHRELVAFTRQYVSPPASAFIETLAEHATL